MRAEQVDRIFAHEPPQRVADAIAFGDTTDCQIAIQCAHQTKFNVVIRAT